MFDSLPKISRETADQLMKQELPRFVEKFMENPPGASDEVFDALDDIRKTNPSLIWPLSVFDDVINPYKNDITDVEFASLRIFLYKAVLLLLSSIDTALFATKFDNKMKERR